MLDKCLELLACRETHKTTYLKTKYIIMITCTALYELYMCINTLDATDLGIFELYNCLKHYALLNCINQENDYNNNR